MNKPFEALLSNHFFNGHGKLRSDLEESNSVVAEKIRTVREGKAESNARNAEVTKEIRQRSKRAARIKSLPAIIRTLEHQRNQAIQLIAGINSAVLREREQERAQGIYRQEQELKKELRKLKSLR